MNDRLDRGTAERMLRGEDTGPRPLAALLAAASARPVRDDRAGEEAAVAAFRAARTGRGAETSLSRRLLRPRALAVRAVFAGLLLVLAGSVAIAASPHLVSLSRHRSTHATRTPAESGSTTKAVPRPSPHTPLSRSHTNDGDDPWHGRRWTKNKSWNRHDSHGKGSTEPSAPTPSRPAPSLGDVPGRFPPKSEIRDDPRKSPPGM